MIDVNKVIRSILKGLTGVTITYYHPDSFNKMPVVSYYELTTKTGMCYDNAEQAQKSFVVVDIWGKSGAECARIAIETDKLMQKNGWYREFSADLPPEDNIYHKNMRFYKEIFFEEE